MIKKKKRRTGTKNGQKPTHFSPVDQFFGYGRFDQNDEQDDLPDGQNDDEHQKADQKLLFSATIQIRKKVSDI